MDEHELALLDLIGNQLDRIAQLDAIVQREGLMTPGGHIHNAAKESRFLSQSVGRLMAVLRIPDEEADDGRPQRRGAVRGFYRGGATA